MHDILNLIFFRKGLCYSKVDVRSFILKKNKVLLVKERTDNLWTLPGGWIDVNESPSEAVIREKQRKKVVMMYLR